MGTLVQSRIECCKVNGAYRVFLPPEFGFCSASQLLLESFGILEKLKKETRLPKELVFDFTETTHIDTAGMGCILLLAERFGPRTDVFLQNASGTVAQLLSLGNIEEKIAAQRTGHSPSPRYQACVNCGQAERGHCDLTLATANSCPRVRSHPLTRA